jgi:hypothetical protein
LGIWLAERWVQELREGTAPLCERRAPAAPDDGEAWLRRQLAGLGTDHP